jgi:hypothetical protein
MKALSEFTNDEFNRTAIVYKDGETFGAVLYRDGVVAVDRKCHGHTLQYVEDLAENWINKWGEFKV